MTDMTDRQADTTNYLASYMHVLGDNWAEAILVGAAVNVLPSISHHCSL